MRPHVELVDEKDLIWHVAELPHGSGEAWQRNLNYDEEDGAASLLVEFRTDWRARRGPACRANRVVRAGGQNHDWRSRLSVRAATGARRAA